MITGGLLSALSWAGLALLLVVMISYRFLARSKLEQQLYGSPLAMDPGLSESEVKLALERATSDGLSRA